MAIATMASLTKNLKFGTSVLGLPLRNPTILAKQIASLDFLSNGRLLPAVGLGPENDREYESCGTHRSTRSGQPDEAIRIMRLLWSQDDVNFQGKYFSLRNISIQPKPVQKDLPPIWIGGESPPAIRRAANYGDVWYPIGNNPQYPLDTIDRLKNGIEKLNCKLDEADRDINKIGIALSAEMWYSDTDPIFDENGNRKLLTGEPSQVAEDIYNLAEIGVSYLTLDYKGTDIDETLYKMERFTKLVKALL